MNEFIQKAFSVLRALNNKPRIAILNYLRANPESSGLDVQIGLKMGQSFTSQQLGILLKAGVVKRKRDGKAARFSLCDPRINEITDLSARMIGVAGKNMEEED